MCSGTKPKARRRASVAGAMVAKPMQVTSINTTASAALEPGPTTLLTKARRQPRQVACADWGGACATNWSATALAAAWERFFKGVPTSQKLPATELSDCKC